MGVLAGCLLGAALLLIATSAAASAEPIIVCPSNPHYFQYKGKAVLLITSDQHYGAIVDKDFDFAKFLNYMGDKGMNLTRIYPGGYFETPLVVQRTAPGYYNHAHRLTPEAYGMTIVPLPIDLGDLLGAQRDDRLTIPGFGHEQPWMRSK